MKYPVRRSHRASKLLLLLAALLFANSASAQTIPPPGIPEFRVLSADFARSHAAVAQRLARLVDQRVALRSRRDAFNFECRAVRDAKLASCKAEESKLNAEIAAHIVASNDFNASVDSDLRAGAIARDFYLAEPSHALTPMNDGGPALDAPGARPSGLHGLVGGTIWTYGFKWPRGDCGETCRAGVDKSLAQQLALYCTSQRDQKKCLQEGLPFSKDDYDFVVSMGSSHNVIEDLASRVLWDNAGFGAFSSKNKEIFASLKGRQFDQLDCHSNGAMLCLAALRSGETTAKEVRLFGPQITPAAAAAWRDYAAKTGAKIKVYINDGDPAAAFAMNLPPPPNPQTAAGGVATALWLTNPITDIAIADALFYSWLDTRTGIVDQALKRYGLDVRRYPGCEDSPVRCHSMRQYEENQGKPLGR